MKIWRSTERSTEGPTEAIDNEQEVKRKSIMGKAGDSAQGVFMLSLSMVLLLFNLLDRDSSSRL
jgi:hypothetical protein